MRVKNYGSISYHSTLTTKGVRAWRPCNVAEHSDSGGLSFLTRDAR